jgi:hypothetical protein
MRCCIASSTTSRLKDKHNSARLHFLLALVSPSAASRKGAHELPTPRLGTRRV